MTNNEMAASVIIALIPTGFGLNFIVNAIKSSIHSFLDKKIDKKIYEFQKNTCTQKHKEVDEVKEDIKELKKSVGSIAISMASIETAIQIYFGITPRENNDNIR